MSPFLKVLSVKNILIDIGNSSFCKVALADGTSILEVRRVVREELQSCIAGIVVDGAADTICVSTVLEDDPAVMDWLKAHCRRFIMLDAFTPMGLRIDYDTPATLGADRIAAAAAVRAIFPGEKCIIFDFGTALTIDFVSADGWFRGGNISLGLSMRCNALHHYTRKLPLVVPVIPERQAGKSTEEALVNGVVLGIMFEVERYIADNPGARIIFTGGDALFFAKKSNYPIFVICNLVLKGLFKIVQENNV